MSRKLILSCAVFPLLFALTETRNNVNKGFVVISIRIAHVAWNLIVPVACGDELNERDSQ